MGFKTDKSIGLRASNIENAGLEDEDCPLSPSDMEDFRHPAKPLYRSDLDFGATVVSNEDSDEDDYNSMLESCSICDLVGYLLVSVNPETYP